MNGEPIAADGQEMNKYRIGKMIVSVVLIGWFGAMIYTILLWHCGIGTSIAASGYGAALLVYRLQRRSNPWEYATASVLVGFVHMCVFYTHFPLKIYEHPGYYVALMGTIVIMAIIAFVGAEFLKILVRIFRKQERRPRI